MTNGSVQVDQLRAASFEVQDVRLQNVVIRKDDINRRVAGNPATVFRVREERFSDAMLCDLMPGKTADILTSSAKAYLGENMQISSSG